MGLDLPPSDLAPDEGDDNVVVPEDFDQDAPEKPQEAAWGCPACEAVGTPTSEGRCPQCGFHPRKRAENTRDTALGPGSIVGSYFHRVAGDEIIWAGVVVGEPQPGKYLCQVDKAEGIGNQPIQVIVPLDAMMPRTQRISINQPGSAADAKEQETDDVGIVHEWRFFDSREDQLIAYREFMLVGDQERT